LEYPARADIEIALRHAAVGSGAKCVCQRQVGRESAAALKREGGVDLASRVEGRVAEERRGSRRDRLACVVEVYKLVNRPRRGGSEGVGAALYIA